MQVTVTRQAGYTSCQKIHHFPHRRQSSQILGTKSSWYKLSAEVLLRTFSSNNQHTISSWHMVATTSYEKSLWFKDTTCPYLTKRLIVQDAIICAKLPNHGTMLVIANDTDRCFYTAALPLSERRPIASSVPWLLFQVMSFPRIYTKTLYGSDYKVSVSHMVSHRLPD